MSKSIKAKIKLHKGVPTVFVNGKPFHLGSACIDCQRERPIAFLKTNPESICLMWPTEMGTIDDEPDLEAIEHRFADVLNEFPNVLLSCVLKVMPSLNWISQHPEEMTVYDVPDNIKNAQAGRGTEPSWASKQWQQDCARFFRKVIGHLHRVFNGRIILYQIGSGQGGENYPITDPFISGSWSCGDFSKPMLVWFRQRLKNYYHNDVKKLRYAWSDPKVTFEDAMPPDRLERMRTEWFSFRSSAHSQLADYSKACSELIEENVLIWCKAVKEATNNESLTASPMASVLDCGLNAFTAHQVIKNTFERCLKSPYVDMLQSPASYVLRDLGRGDTSAMIPIGTANLNGKMWYRDFDSRTSVMGDDLAKDPPSILWRNPTTAWEDIQLLERDAAYSLMKGGSWFWQEHKDEMYKLPEHVNIAKRIAAVGRGILHANRSMVPGLAVFTNHHSNFHLANSNRLIFAMNYEARRLHWTHAGMACEVYCLDDASHPQMPPHKLIMVTNAFCISNAQVKAIKTMARKNNATIIWLMAPGLITQKGFDLNRVSKIVGFKICALDVEALTRISLIPGAHPWSKVGMSGGYSPKSFGVGPLEFDDSGSRAIGPLFYADTSNDRDAQVIGILNALEQPGLLVKQMDGYTSVFCSAPYIHHALLNAIGADAGAHIYTEFGDLVHVAKNLLLVNANSTGIKKVNWPRKAEVVFDLYSNRTICRESKSWSFNMQQHETRFFFAGSERTAQNIKNAMRGFT